ncbi:hypothetical protein PHYC_03053 [Phycisphaerales bacterium]|nr:hypothetical protein PHYC_03053 [Phycisphaerales bacterium]
MVAGARQRSRRRPIREGVGWVLQWLDGVGSRSRHFGIRCLTDGAQNSLRSKKEQEDEQRYWDSFPTPKD